MTSPNAIEIDERSLISGSRRPAPSQTVCDLVNEVCERWPSRPAIQFADQELSYGELRERIRRLAGAFQDVASLRPGDVVGIHLARSLDLIPAILATQWLGCVYLPLERDLPLQRTSRIVADARPRLIVSDEERDPVDAESGTSVLLRSLLEATPTSAPPAPRRVGMTELAYIMYTSGTTGVPRGVKIDHLGISNRLLWMREFYGFGHSDAVLQKAPLSFDSSIHEMFLPLISGGRVVVAEPRLHASARYLVDKIIAHRITFLNVVPMVLRLILSAERARECRSVRWVVCGGEDWRNPLAEQCKLIMPWADVYNGYGPTEASIAVTIWKYDGRHGYRKPPIGGPITNVHFLVVGPDGRPVSIGETGELWIGGMAVSPGYVNQERFPELWRKFVAVRLTPSGEQMRFFRTGDLVTVLDRDVLEFVGRVDNQVKVRGTRLELEEIEAVVEQVPGVEKAIALVENRDELGLLKIFYVTKENAAATAEDAESTKKRILDHCARSLPPQGVPQRIDRVDSIPLGLNGKVDRRRFVAETPT